MSASKPIDPQSGTGVPRWQLALLFGAPIVLGVRAVYLWNSMSRLDRAREANKKGNRYFKAAKYESAIQCYTEAIELCPTVQKSYLSVFYNNRANAYKKQMKWTEVSQDSSQVLMLYPVNFTAFSNKWQAHGKLDNKKECLEDSIAQSIPEDELNEERMKFPMGNKKRGWMMPSPQYIKSYFGSFTDDIISQPLQMGKKKDEDKDNEGEASEVTARLPDMEWIQDPSRLQHCHHLSSGYLKAKHYMDEENYDKIISECTKEVDSEGRYMAEALLLRATFHLLTRDNEAAEGDLNRIINMQEANVKLRANALIKRGILYRQDIRHLAAKKHFNIAAEIDACNPDVYHHSGQLKMDLRLVDEAVEDFDKSILLRPDFALTQAQRSFALYKQAYTELCPSKTHVQKAMDGFEDVIKRFPTCAEGYALYAQALTKEGRFRKADKMYDKCIEVEPDNANYYVHKGLLQLQWKRGMDSRSLCGLALDLIREAIKIDNKCAFARESLRCVKHPWSNKIRMSTEDETANDVCTYYFPFNRHTERHEAYTHREVFRKVLHQVAAQPIGLNTSGFMEYKCQVHS
ncbi:mitochondrial import receptor subunit TOM70-like isoform X3 [Corythoichthys intestinalis]|uniref:mitochondrial import receptor subunit TOM70-like isoform X3 n=1 Tax=Corythoichthys intestinalis TaxID=161448 RepID=UPI0025A671C0|nr:mitochondrial import receptor subunit TOM70-like isoform X3 [Corythoichthys intestinalis]